MNFLAGIQIYIDRLPSKWGFHFRSVTKVLCLYGRYSLYPQFNSLQNEIWVIAVLIPQVYMAVFLAIFIWPIRTTLISHSNGIGAKSSQPLFGVIL